MSTSAVPSGWMLVTLLQATVSHGERRARPLAIVGLRLGFPARPRPRLVGGNVNALDTLFGTPLAHCRWARRDAAPSPGSAVPARHAQQYCGLRRLPALICSCRASCSAHGDGRRSRRCALGGKLGITAGFKEFLRTVTGGNSGLQVPLPRRPQTRLKLQRARR